MDCEPLVTICSTTYNLEEYIGEAIHSWLSQQTNFAYDIVISDDGSTDNTIQIIESFIQEHPNKITLIKSEHIGKMPNFIRSLQATNGKYVALCDGDDYWIDPLKIQKQVDFMEANPDFSACYTNSYVINEHTQEKKVAKTQIWDEATTSELLDHNDFNPDGIAMSPGHTSTFMYRNGLVDDYPDWMYQDIMTDFPLYMIMSKYGKSKFINDFTSVYRHHSQGVSTKFYSFFNTNNTRIFVLKNINQYFNFKYKKKINQLIARHYINVFRYYRRNYEYFRAIISLFKVLVYSPKVMIDYLFKR